MLRSAIFLMLALAGCQTASTEAPQRSTAFSGGSWRVEQKKNRLTDKIDTSASVIAVRASISSNIGRTNHAILGLNCISKTVTPMVHFGWPIGRTNISVVSYRFDQSPAQRPDVEFIGTEAFVLKAPASKLFVEQLASANNLYIQIASTTGSVASADFVVTGASEPIASVKAGCS